MASNSVRLTFGGKIVAFCGGLFLIVTFLPWHRTCVGVLDAEVCQVDNGWDTGFSALAALVVLALLAEVLLAHRGRFGPSARGIGRDLGRLRSTGSAAAVVLVLLQLLVGDGNLHRSYGIVIGLMLVVALAHGNRLRAQEPTDAVRRPDSVYR